MKFKDALLNAMCELGLNQRQVCGMTGCSKASVSQYLSGKNVPSEQKQREIAEALGLQSDYFTWPEPEAQRTKTIQRGAMKGCCLKQQPNCWGSARKQSGRDCRTVCSHGAMESTWNQAGGCM